MRGRRPIGAMSRSDQLPTLENWGSFMVHVTRRTLALGFVGAAALVITTALPAFADHTAGAELSGGVIAADSCYVGGLVSRNPPPR